MAERILAYGMPLNSMHPVAKWIRFEDAAHRIGFGTVDDDEVVVHAGDMFTGAEPTGERVPLESVEVLIPCVPTKMIALWNNLRGAAEKAGLGTPIEPLYFLKAPSSLVPHRARVMRPSSYSGRILYEGELGVVIGKTCVDVALEDVDDVVFGFTCVNDVTALDLIKADPSFAQWARCKGFRYVRCHRAGNRIGPRSRRVACDDVGRGKGPTGLPSERHVLFATPARQPHLS